MIDHIKMICSAIFLSLSLAIASPIGALSQEPVNFLYTSSGDLTKLTPLLNRSNIQGVQILYSWQSLEPGKDRYDFSQIEADLKITNSLHKKLFVQVQDRFFRPQDRSIPRYLLEEPEYAGGLVPQTDNPGEGKPVAYGWAAAQWNPNLRKRYQRLLEELARHFDGRIYGVNLPETAIDIDVKHPPAGFTCDRYFAAELETMGVARQAFQRTYVVQYVNFWPCEWNNDHQYMSRTFEFAVAHKIGLGGPDIVPYRKGQMKNSYPFFHQYKGQLVLVAMAVQEPTLTYTNPATGKHFTKEEFVAFARDYLGVGAIFWSTSSPWLHR
jgi:hypothetical protein